MYGVMFLKILFSTLFIIRLNIPLVFIFSKTTICIIQWRTVSKNSIYHYFFWFTVTPTKTKIHLNTLDQRCKRKKKRLVLWDYIYYIYAYWIERTSGWPVSELRKMWKGVGKSLKPPVFHCKYLPFCKDHTVLDPPSPNNDLLRLFAKHFTRSSFFFLKLPAF